MFSSNQKLEVSGSIDSDEIKGALKFALSLFDKKTNDICYQIVDDEDLLCIGWWSEPGWTRFPLAEYNTDPTASSNIDLVVGFIKNWLEQQNYTFGYLDGSYDKGFLMKVINGNYSYNNPINNSKCGIVSFEAYTNFFAK